MDMKAKDEYIEMYPYTYKAYYEKKSDLIEHEKHSQLYHLLYDFRIHILMGFTWLTGYAVYQSLSKMDKNK